MAFNIIGVDPVAPRIGLNGQEIGGYTVIQARRKSVQNAEKDIYV